MKITNIYKKTAALIFLMVAALWPAAEAWGQVTGDKYERVKKYYATVDDGSTDKLQNVFDGDEPDTWWNAVKAGTREIIVDFNEEKELAIIKYHGGGNGQEMALRPLQVKVYFSLDGSSWDDVYNFNEIDRKVMNQTLSIPVESRKKARYFKLVLVPGKKNDGSDESLALNEMWFYDSDNKEIKIKEPENYPIGTIKHKPAKWHDLRGSYTNESTGDTFSEKEEMFDLKDNPLIVASNLDPIQATHTMIDTIYMHKGTSITLTLPDYLNSNFSIKSYQRWYSFRTGKTFETRYHEDNPEKVWDLLTPTDLGDDVYRLKNGYVGNPLKAGNPAYKMDFYFPTDEEFRLWFNTSIDGNTPGRDNNWYVVACDVSTYKDYTSDETKLEEPTLSHRILYYICAVENENNWYPKALKNQQSSSSDTYLEEYEITMPATRIPNRTNELVALSKDARSYVLPDGTKNSGSLTVTIEENTNTAGIFLTSSATSTTGSNFVNLTGSNRCIFFRYPSNGGNTDGTYSVTQPTDGSIPTATILVKSGNYRIARYKLKFVEESRLLSQSMVKEIDNPTGQTDNASWRKLTYRTPKALAESDMYELLTELNFDYNNNFTELDQYRPDEYYPFPMAWSYSSYGFYDGSKATYHAGNQNCAQWGYYAITSDYVECQDGGWGKSFAEPVPLKNSEGNESTYHLYVDASDRAGVIARLPFHENLCPGSELFVSAWVKNARENNDTDNAAILFTIWGIKSGNRIPLYRYQTGQIPSTYIPGNVALSGFDSDKNEWMHVYFSFIDDSEIDFDSYEVQLDNNSASTQGGDMYVDDIRVYMARPRASIKQKRIECDKRTMVNFRINWDQLYSRLGGDFVVDEIDGIDFCMLDTLKYREVIPYAERASATQDEIKEAIQASAVWIGNNTEDASNYYNQQYGTLYYKWDFNENRVYNDSDGDCLAANNNIGTSDSPKYAFYSLTENDENYLAVDIQAELVPTRTYWLLIQDHEGTVLTQENFASCFGNPDDNCAMRSKLSVEGQNLVKINGEVVTDENLQNYCIGQSFEFSVDMRAFDDSGDEVEEDASNIYFDWFFGSKEEFEEKQANYGNVSLEEALDAFRYYYHDKGDLTGVTEQGDLTETHISLIQHYLEQNPDGEGLNSQLVLYRKTLEIRLLEDGLKLAVIPINPEPDDEQIFCFNPSFLELGANGKAPQVQPGFEYVDYQDANGVTNDAYNPAMRIGLKQIKASESENNTITVNLRNAKFAYGDSDTNKPANYKPEHLGLMDEDGDDNATSKGYIYLVGSDDPAYADLFGEDMHQYVIGTVESLYAKPSPDTPDDNKMTIKFNLTDPMEAGGSDAFDPKEGYSYTMHIHVEEKTNGGTSITSSCYGNMNLVMKVVPEYLEWSGTKTSDNWHDDALWKRIPSDRINKVIDESSSDYFTNGSNTTEKAYVPMLFTKVIMPKDSKVELYKAGFEGDFTKNMEWKTERPGHINPPAIVNIEDGQPIYYDMMVYSRKGDNTDMATKPFRVSLLDEIHFEPGAEMMHAELLTYKKAWVDYQLAGGRWYALSSPLKDVVSGDFYTDPSGTEKQEYFTDITWSNDNSRINPSVYQRGWKDANATMVGVGSGDTGKRAIAGNWSAVYNKANEGYDAGTGFSLKVLDLPASNTTGAIFRLPKADTKYTYSGGTTTAQETDLITRTNANKLHITDLNAGATTPTSISVTLEANGNNPYYLVGNPFMAHLDMDAFFAKNSNLESKYWVVKGDNQEVGVGGDNGLITTGNGKIAPLSSFFVTKNGSSATNDEVIFTADMQTLNANLYAGDDDQVNDNALTITATTSDGRTSRAAVAYDMAASADYEASEDAELFLDSNLGDVPMVYTVAGTMATSINRTSELYNIPLGVYGNKQEMVTLSFGGLNQFSSATLYDAQEQTETPLREGKTVSVPAGTSGRYFLRAGTPTGNEVIARNAFLVYSVGSGKVMVTSSNTPLKDIRVYTMGGAQVRSIQASGMQQEIYLNRGIYLITVSDQDGLQETRKVLVR